MNYETAVGITIFLCCLAPGLNQYGNTQYKGLNPALANKIDPYTKIAASIVAFTAFIVGLFAQTLLFPMLAVSAMYLVAACERIRLNKRNDLGFKKKYKPGEYQHGNQGSRLLYNMTMFSFFACVLSLIVLLKDYPKI